MSNIKLFMAPGTCARVAAICLEEAGLEFETVVIRFMRGEHRSEAYLRLNPKGKVPALQIDGHVLTENLAIVSYLNERFPDAGLLPNAEETINRIRALEDLAYCSSTLHPIVTRIRMSTFFAGQECAENVWQWGCKAMADNFALVERRLSGQMWWYGDTWSALDAYIYWVYWRVAGAGFETASYPHYSAHALRMEERAPVQAALERERQAEDLLKSEGILFVPPPPPGSTGES